MNKINIRIGQYNILSPTYGIKWKEREALTKNGEDNWHLRVNVIIDILQNSDCDIIALQEVEKNTILDLKKN